MRVVTGRVTNLEIMKARHVLDGHALPEGVDSVTVEPGADHDGDPIMLVWLNVVDANRPDRTRAEHIADFTRQVGNELYDVLEEYRPQFRIRAA